jgi:hypothetical protein
MDVQVAATERLVNERRMKTKALKAHKVKSKVEEEVCMAKANKGSQLRHLDVHPYSSYSSEKGRQIQKPSPGSRGRKNQNQNREKKGKKPVFREPGFPVCKP